MGRKERTFKDHSYADKLHHDELQTVAARNTSSAKLTVIPFLSAACTALLAFGIGWIQAQSKDLLPEYMMGPAIVGAVFAGVTAPCSIGGYVLLRKGDGYHEKEEKKHRDQTPRKPLQPDDLKLKSHPIYMWHWVLLGSAVCTSITVGSYLYMAVCLVASSDEYCVAYAPGVSKDECKVKGNDGMTTVFLLLVVTAIVSALLFVNNQVVEDNLKYFDYRHQRLKRLAGPQAQIVGKNRLSTHPPAYGEVARTDPYGREKGETQSDPETSDLDMSYR